MTPVVMHILVLFITSLTLMAELLENGFDKIDIVTANHKHMQDSAYAK